MFKSKSTPADQPASAVAPTGDAAAAQRLTGTPTANGAATTAAPAADTPNRAPNAPALGGSPAAGTAGGTSGGATPAQPGTRSDGTHPIVPEPAPGKPGAASSKTAPPAGPSVVKRTTSNVKRVLLLVIGALIALFAVFNSQNVQVHWIFGDAVNTPLIVVIVIAFAAGGAIGWLVAKLGARNRTT